MMPNFFKSHNVNLQPAEFDNSAFDYSTSASLHNMEAESIYHKLKAGSEVSRTSERSSTEYKENLSVHPPTPSHLVRKSIN